MQGVTLAIGIVGSILVLLLRPAYALATYVAVLVWYPDYLRVSIGTIDISAGRIVVTVLLLRCLVDERILRKFVWSRLDKLVTLSMVVYVGIYCLTRPPLSAAIENRSGFLIDTWLVYFIARLCITDHAAACSVVKLVAVALVPLAVLGVVEATTGWQPFMVLRQYCPWRPVVPIYNARWGLTRAWGPSSHPIIFGACFSVFVSLVWSLRRERGYWGKLAWPLTLMVVAGAFSSMSSTLWAITATVIFCLVMERYKQWVKPTLWTLVFMCIVVEIISNRHFYHVLASAANFVGGDWWQRAKLIDAAIGDFDKWWLAGYGGEDPGWGRRYFWAEVSDVNNEFIMKGVECGLLGVVALCTVFVVSFQGLVRAFRETKDRELRSLYWSLGSALVGEISLFMGVSLFGQAPMLFYFLLGMIGSSFGFTKCVSAYSREFRRLSNEDLVLVSGAEARST